MQILVITIVTHDDSHEDSTNKHHSAEKTKTQKDFSGGE